MASSVETLAGCATFGAAPFAAAAAESAACRAGALMGADAGRPLGRAATGAGGELSPGRRRHRRRWTGGRDGRGCRPSCGLGRSRRRWRNWWCGGRGHLRQRRPGRRRAQHHRRGQDGQPHRTTERTAEHRGHHWHRRPCRGSRHVGHRRGRRVERRRRERRRLCRHPPRRRSHRHRGHRHWGRRHWGHRHWGGSDRRGRRGRFPERLAEGPGDKLGQRGHRPRARDLRRRDLAAREHPETIGLIQFKQWTHATIADRHRHHLLTNPHDRQPRLGAERRALDHLHRDPGLRRQADPPEALERPQADRTQPQDEGQRGQHAQPGDQHARYPAGEEVISTRISLSTASYWGRRPPVA